MGGKEIDDEIKAKFLPLIEKLSDDNNHEYDGWLESPQGTLCAIIALDQFTRNVYRGDPKGLLLVDFQISKNNSNMNNVSSLLAFASDPKALRLAYEAVNKGFHKRIEHPRALGFLYHPFMHAENLDAQKKCT